MRFGGTSVPSVRPIAEPASAPKIIVAATNPNALARQGIEPSIQIPTGNMTMAASSARIEANSIFSIATAQVGNGASSRSSISRLNENSSTSGNAVL